MNIYYFLCGIVVGFGISFSTILVLAKLEGEGGAEKIVQKITESLDRSDRGGGVFFAEPITFEEKFKQATRLDDLIKSDE